MQEKNVDVAKIILELRAHYSIPSDRELAKIIKVSNNVITNWKKRGSIGSIKNILDTWPELSRTWLETGEGSMMKMSSDDLEFIKEFGELIRMKETKEIMAFLKSIKKSEVHAIYEHIEEKYMKKAPRH